MRAAASAILALNFAVAVEGMVEHSVFHSTLVDEGQLLLHEFLPLVPPVVEVDFGAGIVQAGDLEGLVDELSVATAL